MTGVDHAPQHLANGSAGAAVPPGPHPAAEALGRAVRELERHVARGGWDAPVRVFALIRTAQAIERDPALADQLPPDLVGSAATDRSHITSVEQEDLPDAEGLDQLLARISWPGAVDGAAIVCERVVLPPDVERDLPADPDEAVTALMAHPQREDVRLAVGVLRDGTTSCAVRTRRNDDDLAVGTGADLVPGLTAALTATLRD
ncbi:MAG TPA: PPA1309 family protein [Actinomycetales bacterium]|nr:PPA1309 family protein [Actinomycetales bacterium]